MANPSAPSGLKRAVFSGLAMLLGGGLALGTAELLLRLNGRQPWRYVRSDTQEPTMNDPDPELGWRPKAGEYVIPPYTPNGLPIRMTLLPGGRRYTGAHDPHPAATLAFIGCSITQGWAISDDESFPYRLQRRFPSVQMLNYASGGYGTYQSLLVLERLLSAPGPAPTAVLYGFIQQHEWRNIAHPMWLQLLAKYSKRGTVAVPYAMLGGDGGLVRFPPERYPQWPLREYLATVTLLQESYANFTARPRMTMVRKLTQELVLQMHRLCARHNVRFIVVLLPEFPTKEAYLAFFARNGIDAIHCAATLPPSMRVPGEGHPDSRANAIWANCVGERLQTYAWLPTNQR